MAWTRLDSTHIHSIDYDSTAKTLSVKFHAGRIWNYYDVDQQHYQALLEHESSGGYFAKHIKPHHSGRPTR